MTKEEMLAEIDKQKVSLRAGTALLEALREDSEFAASLDTESFALLLIGVDYLSVNFDLIADRIRMS
jgi:hypothetical protein